MGKKYPELVAGFKSGKLTVICKSDQKQSNYRALYLCSCECGGQKLARKDVLISQELKSCGCLRPVKFTTPLTRVEVDFIRQNYSTMGRAALASALGRDPVDIGRRINGLGLRKRFTSVHPKGARFGRYVLVEDLGSVGKIGSKQRLYRVQCDCGTVRDVKSNSLIAGRTVSCGCFQKEQHTRRARKAPGAKSFNSAYGNYRTGARQRGHEFKITLREFISIVSKDCRYCGSEPKLYNSYLRADGSSIEKGITQEGIDRSWIRINGIDRVDNSTGYLLENCVPCCQRCNYAKRDLTPEDFIEHSIKIASHCMPTD